MTNIIVAMSKLDDARNLKSVLARGGIRVTGICVTGAQTLSQVDGLHDGIVICGYKLADMLYDKLYENLPTGFEMLLMAPQRLIDECYGNDIVCLSLPLKSRDLVDTVNMITENIERRRRNKRRQITVRSEEEERIIKMAKAVLMERNHMTEPEAHKYLQKSSMDSGSSFVECANMVLAMMKE